MSHFLLVVLVSSLSYIINGFISYVQQQWGCCPCVKMFLFVLVHVRVHDSMHHCAQACIICMLVLIPLLQCVLKRPYDHAILSCMLSTSNLFFPFLFGVGYCSLMDMLRYLLWSHQNIAKNILQIRTLHFYHHTGRVKCSLVCTTLQWQKAHVLSYSSKIAIDLNRLKHSYAYFYSCSIWF